MANPSRRRGKIAQLPKEIRDEVNRMIENNARSSAIIRFLVEKGYPGINKVNITHWVQGDGAGSSGYQDWQREQRALAELRAQEEFALELVKENQAHSLHDASRLLAVGQLTHIFSKLDVLSLAASLPEKPQNYIRLLNALGRLSRDGRDYEQHRLRLALRQKELDAAMGRPTKGGLMPELLEEIQDTLNLV
jgi:hypothetical protein